MVPARSVPAGNTSGLMYASCVEWASSWTQRVRVRLGGVACAVLGVEGERWDCGGAVECRESGRGMDGRELDDGIMMLVALSVGGMKLCKGL